MDTDVSMDIRIKPVDMDMDMDAKFHILAEPGCRSWHIVDCWKGEVTSRSLWSRYDRHC